MDDSFCQREGTRGLVTARGISRNAIAILCLGSLIVIVAIWVYRIVSIRMLLALPIETQCLIAEDHLGLDREHAALFPVDSNRYAFVYFLDADSISSTYVCGDWVWCQMRSGS